MGSSGSHLLTGGRILTEGGWAEALLVEDGHVLATGSARSVRRLRPVGAELTRLGGRLVIPGLIDAHLHLAGLAMNSLGVDLASASSLGDMLERTARWMADHPNVPVWGRGWDQERFAERRFPRRADLDRLGGRQPVVLFRVCGHAAVLNSTALQSLGIDRRTGDPTGGRVGRGTDGEPDGLLFDAALANLDPLRSRALSALAERLRPLLTALASTGLTSVASMSASATETVGLGRLDRTRPLPVRVRLYVDRGVLPEVGRLRRRLRSPGVRITGVKLFADGSFGARTAWLTSPYADAPGERGFPVARPKEILAVARAAADTGLQAAVHAIGDRALGEVLRAFRNARRLRPPRIEHASLVPPALWSSLDRVRPTLVVQPGFVASDWWINERLGPRRARWAYPFRTLATRGHHLAGSSDAPVESPDPWVGLRVAVQPRRPTSRHRPRPPEQVSPTEAIRWYTSYAAEALGEPTLGRLSAGAEADLVILRAHSLAGAFRDGSRGVVATWRSGHPVFRRRDS